MEIDLKALAEALKSELGVNQRETISLTKNTKGYNWDIKVFVDTDEKTLERLVTLNDKMVEKFGVVSNE